MINNFKKEELQNSIIINSKNGNIRNEEAVDIDNLVGILDSFADSNVERLKLKVSDESQKGSIIDKQYHHGRCDIGSPWAKGESFDVLE
ncbi:MAG: hypothetical protein IIX45_04750 [Lachnospiraceae bacterium]|nr:hypothetical protein [Lachnospiraceae bacterium]MBQ2115875.1 hypothetical protein [Lachnospiraceae bacterium]MBQ2405997.1 hypothetical protein [Lachnospiraceae bacterium]MEE0918937.1 hypothetical protein [Lachnospiraceae bacterium]